MSALTSADFLAFFEAIHGHTPFMWQKRLLKEVLDRKTWPRLIAAPTGAGKTAVLDIALFHLAMESHNRAQRAAPLRICFAVDRRIIVDQAYDRALDIGCVLDRAQGRGGCKRETCVCERDPERASRQEQNPVVRRVAEALASFGDRPLHVEQLRGGMPREDDWARTPAQPTILCTTVDQLGSRLLFRGYGVSERMAPVHAGLLGEDCLLLLDEAHLSQAFLDTLNGVERWRKERDCMEAQRPWGFAALTATPGANAEDVFVLKDEEKNERAIRARLEAVKYCALRQTTDGAFSAKQVSTFVDAAKELAGDIEKSGRTSATIAIVVNRVHFARQIFETLKGESTILLTGRARPVERDDVVKKHASRLFAGSARPDGDGPLFVVATQCIEAGADFDFDALVTQIAPLDALRQRFGRLNRLGEKSAAPAVLIAAKDEIAKSSKPDPIYGDYLKKTWEWLNSQAVEKRIDFGPNAMQALIEKDRAGADACIAEGKNAPILRGADVAFLSMTHPRPHPDPEIGLFLRGELDRGVDVAIVWRADIEECFDKQGEDADARRDRLGAILDLARPRPGEALRVPVWEARRWLRDEHDAKDTLADVDSGAPDEERTSASGKWLARRKRGDAKGWEFVDASGIKSGDTLIAPSSYGGCDRFGWAPESKENVPDIADAAAKPYEHRRAFLRLHPKLWRSDGEVAWENVAAIIGRHERAAGSLIDELLGLVRECDEDSSQELRRRLEHFRRGAGVVLERPYDSDDSEEAAPEGAVLWARRGLAGAAASDSGEAVTDDGDAGSFMASACSLSTHRTDVHALAREFATAIGLSPRIAETAAIAALLHDDGKADPRFQLYLSGGATSAEFLAKSARRPRGDDRAARAASNLPEKWRHEALSVRLAAAELDQGPHGDIDPELALWLVGAHHGYGRPFFPHDDDWDDHARSVPHAEGGAVELTNAPGPQRLDFEWRGMDWAQLFERLKRRYGVWGLAYLEAIVRLADHRASEKRDRSS